MVLISLVIDGRIFTRKALVVDDLSHDVILGKDFLERYKSKLDLEHYTLHLQDDLTFEGFSSSEFDSLQDNTCSVHALYSYILSPNSETIICGKHNTPFLRVVSVSLTLERNFFHVTMFVELQS